MFSVGVRPRHKLCPALGLTGRVTVNAVPHSLSGWSLGPVSSGQFEVAARLRQRKHPIPFLLPLPEDRFTTTPSIPSTSTSVKVRPWLVCEPWFASRLAGVIFFLDFLHSLLIAIHNLEITASQTRTPSLVIWACPSKRISTTINPTLLCLYFCLDLPIHPFDLLVVRP